MKQLIWIGEVIMATIKGQADKYIDFLVNELDLTKIDTNLLTRDLTLILSPGIQGEKTKYLDISVSKINSVRSKMINFTNNFLIIRFYDVFLIADLKQFLNKMTNEKYIYSPPGNPTTRKWQYTVEEDSTGYFICLTKNPKEKFRLLLVEHVDIKEYFNDINGAFSYKSIEKKLRISEFIPSVCSYISTKGFIYSENNIKNLYLSLRSKPFVIISGISGTGKTKVVQLFAESIGATKDNGQFKLIPVRPDWSDSSDLIGYTDLKGDFIKGPLTRMVERAIKNPNAPHFILLDEMNLARVEYYFSDVLSVMESRSRENGEITSSPLISNEDFTLHLPGNLYIIGTVNMDETTHPFSKKVLDRANTIEFNEINLLNLPLALTEKIEPICITNEMLQSKYIHLIDLLNIDDVSAKNYELLVIELSEKLVSINTQLEKIHAQVGYRVRDEICFYMAYNDEFQILSKNEAFDFCIMQKILPRISGSGDRIENVLKALYQQFTNKVYVRETEVQDTAPYRLSAKKTAEMLRRLEQDGFTSFWIS